MAETVDATPDASQTQAFQSLNKNDLSDLKLPADLVATSPAAVETAAEPPPPAPAAGSGETGAGQPLAVSPADGQSAAPVLKEAKASPGDTNKRKSGRPRRPIRAACGVVLVLALAAGVWLFTRYYDPRHSDAQPRTAPQEVVVAPEAPSFGSGGSVAVPEVEFSSNAKLREIDKLRQTLLAKKEEILLLQQNYQYGILELEEEASRLIRRGGFESLAHALKNRQLELALQSIQRRHSYHDSLARPLHWIDAGSEELLYLQRRAFFDLQLKEIAEDIDMTAHMADIDAALIKYQPTVEKLSINNSVALQPTLEVIWKRLAEQARQVDMSAEDQRNQDIISEACSGQFGRLSELSSLTRKGARCLAESGAMQLFLNHLSGMTPAAAKKLCEWPGQWLCLNGIRRLSPEVASQLFEWPGEWMSLNGLSEVSEEAARHLLRWKGRQLELMGLRKSTGIEFLAQWEASGGKLFVPDDIRQQIETFRRTGQPPAQGRNSRRS